MPKTSAILSSPAVAIARLVLAIACLALVPKVWAHGPTDHSLELVVVEDRLEAEITLGMDGVEGVLDEAGWSPPEIRSLVAARGPDARTTLTSELASRFLELRQEDRSLGATDAWSHSDGMHITFRLDYPRPAGDFTVRAVYLETVDVMSPGWMRVRDETGAELRVTRLAPDAAETMVALSLRASSGEPLVVAPSSPARPADPPAASDTGSNPPAASLDRRAMIGLALVALAGLMAALIFRHRSGRNQRQPSPP